MLAFKQQNKWDKFYKENYKGHVDCHDDMFYDSDKIIRLNIFLARTDTFFRRMLLKIMRVDINAPFRK